MRVFEGMKMGFLRNSPKNSPKAFEKSSSTTLKSLFDLDSKNNNILRSPKNVRQSSESQHKEVLSIISHCSFIDPSESPSSQDLKRLKLNHLLSMLKTSKNPLSDHQLLLPSLMSMLSANIFRPLPTPSTSCWTSELPEDEEVVSAPSPAWPHLQLVYEILMRLVLNEDPKALRNYIDNRFLLNLLSLFQSEDPRERESLKNLYHRIYSRFTFYRSLMRKSMKNVFLHYVFGTEKHYGIGELLEIWGSIINGFAVPLREEHKLFLMRVLIPLHKTKGMQSYHRQLAYCVSQFVHKDPVLGGVVIRGILRYWPITNCQKEILLIGEIEGLVENIDPDQYRKLALPICTKIIKCVNSWNSQVAERALYVWNNEHFVKMTSSATEEVFPVVVEGMEKNLKEHWNNSIKQLTENVKLMLKAMNPSLYYKCLQEIDQKESSAREEGIKREQNWERIELAAARNHFLQICLSHSRT